MTEEQWYREHAAEIVAIARDMETGRAGSVLIIDDAGHVAQQLDKHAARAVAVRLVELAAELPEPAAVFPREDDRRHDPES